MRVLHPCAFRMQTLCRVLLGYDFRLLFNKSFIHFPNENEVLVLDVLLVCSVVFYFVDSSPFYLVIAIMAMIAFTYIAYRLNRQNRDEPLL